MRPAIHASSPGSLSYPNLAEEAIPVNLAATTKTKISLVRGIRTNPVTHCCCVGRFHNASVRSRYRKNMREPAGWQESAKFCQAEGQPTMCHIYRLRFYQSNNLQMDVISTLLCYLLYTCLSSLWNLILSFSLHGVMVGNGWVARSKHLTGVESGKGQRDAHMGALWGIPSWSYLTPSPKLTRTTWSWGIIRSRRTQTKFNLEQGRVSTATLHCI